MSQIKSVFSHLELRFGSNVLAEIIFSHYLLNSRRKKLDLGAAQGSAFEQETLSTNLSYDNMLGQKAGATRDLISDTVQKTANWTQATAEQTNNSGDLKDGVENMKLIYEAVNEDNPAKLTKALIEIVKYSKIIIHSMPLHQKKTIE